MLFVNTCKRFSSLRYHWHGTVCQFQVCNMMIRYLCISRSDHHTKSSVASITHRVTHLFLVMKTFKSHSFSSFQIYNSICVTVVSMLSRTLPGPVLWLDVSTFWPFLCISPPLPPPTPASVLCSWFFEDRDEIFHFFVSPTVRSIVLCT